jgi:hypothetical protein
VVAYSGILIYIDSGQGSNWNLIKELLLPGSTVIPVILGSDKAHLTVLSGNKKGWPVYLSIGNIKSCVRNKINNGAWVTIAHIPIVKFYDHPDTHTALQGRLFHQCMRIIMSSLVTAGDSGVHLTDSRGHVCNCYPRLAAYIADYPEQILVNIAAQNASPTSIAVYKDLDSPTPLPPRTRDWILGRINHITASVDPQDVLSYINAAKEYRSLRPNRTLWPLPVYTTLPSIYEVKTKIVDKLRSS